MNNKSSGAKPNRRTIKPWIIDLILVLILLAGAFFRFAGIYWGEYQYLHPDERFLVWVGTDISPVENLGGYFDTQNSSLNPHNRGHGFYVYGTLPMFLTRYLVEWAFGKSGFQEMTQIGRPLSALVDLFTVFLVYLVAERLYNKRVALLAAAFSAATVLQIQQSHFFTMDTFMNAFSFLAFYFAVRIVTIKNGEETGFKSPGEANQIGSAELKSEDANQKSDSMGLKNHLIHFFRDPFLLPSLGFGIALGMAVASKINAAPMAVVLPAAMLLYLLRLPRKERLERAWEAFLYLVLAGFTSLLVFRILQPYAFSGPGFFGIHPNPEWLDNLRTLSAQSGGDVDFPPAMQWARRPPWFSFKNLVLWGMGLPLGILAWTGFLWVGWRLLCGWKNRRDEWLKHALIWGWTAIYFTWQSLALNPTMRYQLPIYPTLAIFAAWAIIALYNYKPASKIEPVDIGDVRHSTNIQPPSTIQRPSSFAWPRLAAILLSGIVLISTYAYALGFTLIYVHPITRVAASEWIYQNIPGPISLPIQTGDGVYHQSIPVPYSLSITPSAPFVASFEPKTAGVLDQVYLPRLKDLAGDHQVRTLTLSIDLVPSAGTPLASAVLIDDLTPADDPRGKSFTLDLDQSISLEPDQTYNLRLELPAKEQPSITLESDITLVVQPSLEESENVLNEYSLNTPSMILHPDAPLITEFQISTDGLLRQILARDILNQNRELDPRGLRLSLRVPDLNDETLTTGLSIQKAPDGQGYLLLLDTPLPIVADISHFLAIEAVPIGGAITLSGMGLANEGEWDDGLPLRMGGYDGFGGIYPTGLNFNMYWDENPEKLERFTNILDQADYLAISSSRQWGSLPRIPERFPLTTLYYRNLLGCPPDQVIETCFNIAKPGLFKGNLGYELEAVFASNPRLGPLQLNDQFAEEAFTVYDHPKVFIFKKAKDYNPGKVREILGVVDFTKVQRFPPMQTPSQPANLMLPDHRLAEQRQGGTWSGLFDSDALINRSQPLSVLTWYLSVFLLGIIVYPLLRLAAPGLADRGYPLARTAGMLILSYLVWIAGSLRIPASQATISAVLITMTLVGAFLAYRQWGELLVELRRKRNYFLIIEGLTLTFFLAFLLVRLANPDLWHPWKGGEKPMDFAYFNAVLKSTSFPPYDPWFSGGYLNYYYYGFVLVGVLVKWLGITPSVAYNLVLPTLFSMIAMGAFSLAWNLSKRGEQKAKLRDNEGCGDAAQLSPFIPAIAAALGAALLGNLGTPRMLFQGYQKLIAPGGIIEDAHLLTRWVWAVRGLTRTFQGAKLPYSLGDWYWIPSRAIPPGGDIEPITEFPYFTLLYADLHAHLLALPLTLLVLSFCAAIILGGARWKSALGGVLWVLMTALFIGSLRPTNTWDLPPYLALGLIATGYALWANYQRPVKALRSMTLLQGLSDTILRGLIALGGMILVAALSFLLYQPYAQWYTLGYTEVRIWEGSHTPFSAYLTHWGLFLFLIITWMVWETRDWMAKTPLSALRQLAPFRGLIQVLLVVLVLVVAGLTFFFEVQIAWFILPLAAWAGILILRPGQSEAKRIVLFLIGSGLVLTLMVEVIVLVGDIGRMNTVFKFYLQTWTFFSISAAAALGWLLPALVEWAPGWRRSWEVVFAVLVAGAALYPMMATMAKIEDRIAPEAPYTLDGMAFMPYATYSDEWGAMDLGQDYRAIRWMQENVEDSPVIVEANLRDLYRWGSRYSNYTGLPGIIGWEWHQQQQRAVLPGDWVSERIRAIEDFYQTTDLAAAVDFLRKYDVRYIIVGQQERGKYPGPGLEKFTDLEGLLWHEVYREGETAIYEVNLDYLIK